MFDVVLDILWYHKKKIAQCEGYNEKPYMEGQNDD